MRKIISYILFKDNIDNYDNFFRGATVYYLPTITLQP